jgi:hypothetical protein
MAKFNLLVLGGVWLAAVLMEPGLENVRCLLGEIAASLPAKGVRVNADMLMKSNFVVGILVARVRWSSIRRPAVVRILGAIIRIAMCGGWRWWGVLVVRLPMLIACTMGSRLWSKDALNGRLTISGVRWRGR